mgnify:CR=1 FL=1
MLRLEMIGLARIYSPTLGRFLQTDPIGHGDGLNWYNYVGSDPVNATDPSGLKDCKPGDSSDDDDPCEVAVRARLHADNSVIGGGGGSGGSGYNFQVFRGGINDLGTLFGGSTAPVDVTVTAKRNNCPKPGNAGIVTNGIGVAFGTASYLAGKLFGTNPSVQSGPNGIRVTNSPLNFGNRAVTLGNIQIYTPRQTPQKNSASYTGAIVNIGRHEDGHSYQATALGDAYLPSVILGGLLYGDKNPLEPVLKSSWEISAGCA